MGTELKEKRQLMDAAIKARLFAYAPYSHFSVGAALLTKSGKVFAGCNVENASLGLTSCAEQGAVSAAVAAGEMDFVAIAVVADSKGPVFPCGRCRQVLAEFNERLQIVSSTLDKEGEVVCLSELLPNAREELRQALKNDDTLS